MDDLIDGLLGLEAGSGLGLLRRERGDIRRHTQGAYRELVVPEVAGGVTLEERSALALMVAKLEGDGALAGWYRGVLQGVATPDVVEAAESAEPAGGRLGLLLAYGGMVAGHPGRVDQGDIDGLGAAGFSAQDIVAVTQLVAFVPFQVRLLAGLRAMNDVGGSAGLGAMPAMAGARFTMAEVGWVPRVPPVVAETATAAQLAALEACPPAVRRSTYFLTLALDPGSLGERGALFNSVMYAPRGLPRADRELATAVVSMVNGCVYCCSVHARRHAELVRSGGVMEGLMAEGFGSGALDARSAAVVGFAARLTARPGGVGGAEVAALRGVGLSELEVLDLVHAVAMFANANRLMQALGASVVG